MKKIAWVVSDISTGGSVCLPVLYTIIKEDGNPDSKFVCCRVALKLAELPKWLSPAEFIVRQVHNRDTGTTVVEFEDVPCINDDTAMFVRRAHECIKHMERL
jgi:hypothetical protein